MVSVIMPVYNAEKYVAEAVYSVLNQTYKDMELIIVDDYSTDNTLTIIEGIPDERVHIYKNSENKGIAFSTNLGIQYAKGEYIALLDDDDIAIENRLELQVEYLDKYPEIDILGGRSVYIDENGDVIRYSGEARNNPYYIKAMLLFQCLDFMNGTTMMRRKFVNSHNLCYRDGCLGMQDYMFFVEASKVGKISSLNRFLLKSRIHSESETTHQQNDNREERKKVYNKIREKSFDLSGFQISVDDMSFLNYVLPENDIRRLTKEECKRYSSILFRIKEQGIRLGVDYQNELENMCKKLLFEKLWFCIDLEDINRFEVII